MQQSRKQQSILKCRTTVILPDKKIIRPRHYEKTYSKALNPQFVVTKPSSLKNLDLATSDNLNESTESSIDNDRSCCCPECGFVNQKIKVLSKRFTAFQTQMSVLRRKRLQKRLQNAVFCILYLIDKWKKIRQLEKAKRMFRFKTKVFENSPLFPAQLLSNQKNIQFHNSQNQNDERQQMNPQVFSIQAKIIDQRRKQRQSVKLYLQQKLTHKLENQVLPYVAYSKYTSTSFSTQALHPIRLLKTQGDEQKTPQQHRDPANTQHQLSSAPSPYLSHLTGKSFVEHQFHTLRSPRQFIKSVASDTFFPKKNNKNNNKINQKKITNKLRDIV